MWKLNDVKKIKYLRPYFYHVEFDDGVRGEVDLSRLIAKGPVFKPLKAIEFFRTARIEGGTLAWPNGADVAPESLYEAIVNPPKARPRRRAA